MQWTDEGNPPETDEESNPTDEELDGESEVPTGNIAGLRPQRRLRRANGTDLTSRILIGSAWVP